MDLKGWRLARLVIYLSVSLGTSGCALLLVGAGAAGGYAISRDAVTNHFDRSKDFVFHQSLEVLKNLGEVTLEDAKHGIIKATVHDAHVTVTVKQVTPKTVELKVKARNVMPKIEVAQEVYSKIAEKL